MRMSKQDFGNTVVLEICMDMLHLKYIHTRRWCQLCFNFHPYEMMVQTRKNERHRLKPGNLYAYHDIFYKIDPPPVINGVKTPIIRIVKPVTNLFWPFAGVINPFITGRGPSCSALLQDVNFHDPTHDFHLLSRCPSHWWKKMFPEIDLGFTYLCLTAWQVFT